MDLSKALENLKFDVRMKEWNLKTGLVKEKEVEENLKNLKDMSAQAVPLDFQDQDESSGDDDSFS